MRSFYLRVISAWYAKIAVEDSVMKLEIVYALREQMSFQIQKHEILKNLFQELGGSGGIWGRF